MIDLGTLGGDYSHARAINDFGQVVGTSNTIEANGPHAFLTGHNGVGMIDLSILEPVIAAGWTQLTPYSINNKGQVFGYGVLRGNYVAFLLTPSEISPIPEPSTYAMLLAGLGVLGFSLKRQTKSSLFNA
ncbi:putative secreted protein with PEP-CTERM sorting signal [Nitrosomonas oligotropha]|uniref:Putative secreted protein with PEP-CTERM sorting signal n=1 Tax=Nitrosomonas oligotropha TaxID=42354 RepID=A0A2T5HGW8_9PROT|nr:HAF repeat-containing PEP-CTERM protein [Nitrosomonas oligotropha]PTQ70815.1 putative secreted protein with PEP-CTERM sorting signal [Nitrosomonas oligotropha]